MKVDIEQVATCVRRLTIEIPSERVNRELSAICNSLQKRVKIPGFRQGKIPRSILENYYRQTIEQEVLQRLVPEALSEAMVKESVQSVGEPHIDQIALAKDQPLRFVATTQIIPNFSVPDYHGWPCERRIPEVTDAQVEEGLQNLRERHAVLQTITGRAVGPHDFVIMDYIGTVDGRPAAGLSGTNGSFEISANQLIPEIEAALLGMSQGEERGVEVPFPADHRDGTLAGKTVHFQLRLVEIKEKILPTLDDEFARTEDTDSLDALRQRVREELGRLMAQRADAVLRRDVLARMVAETSFDVPEVLVHDQLHRLYAQQKRLETGQEPTEQEHEIDHAVLEEVFGDKAREAVRGQLILRRIGTDAGITVAATELEAEVASLAARTAQNPDALRKAMERNGSLSSLEGSLWEQKIFAEILSHVHITDTFIKNDEASTADVQGDRL